MLCASFQPGGAAHLSPTPAPHRLKFEVEAMPLHEADDSMSVSSSSSSSSSSYEEEEDDLMMDPTLFLYVFRQRQQADQLFQERMEAHAMQAAATLLVDHHTSLENKRAPYHKDVTKRPRDLKALCDLPQYSCNHNAFYQEFRFSMAQMIYLVEALEVPQYFQVKGTHKVRGELAFALLCARLGQSSCVLGQMETKFGWDRTYICRWTNEAMRWLVDTYGHLLEFHVPTVAKHASTWAEAVGRKLGYTNPTENRFILAIDGVFVAMCKPRVFQETVWNGHYHGHGYKFQGLVAPDGICVDLYGPVEGAHHDMYAWRKSRLGQLMDQLPLHQSGEQYFIFGDSAYQGAHAPHLITGIPRRFQLTRQANRFNRRMNQIRVMVEWWFGRMKSMWKGIDYHKKLTVGQSPVGLHILAAGLLTNFRTCLDGRNQISDYFMLHPPPITDYIATPKPAYTRLERMVDESMRTVGMTS